MTRSEIYFHLIDVDDSLGCVANEENQDDCKKERCHCGVPVVDRFQTDFLSNTNTFATILIKLYWIVTDAHKVSNKEETDDTLGGLHCSPGPALAHS